MKYGPKPARSCINAKASQQTGAITHAPRARAPEARHTPTRPAQCPSHPRVLMRQGNRLHRVHHKAVQPKGEPFQWGATRGASAQHRQAGWGGRPRSQLRAAKAALRRCHAAKEQSSVASREQRVALSRCRPLRGRGREAKGVGSVCGRRAWRCTRVTRRGLLRRQLLPSCGRRLPMAGCDECSHLCQTRPWAAGSCGQYLPTRAQAPLPAPPLPTHAHPHTHTKSSPPRVVPAWPEA